MRHGKRFNKLGRPANHRQSMLRNMVTSLFAHKVLKTTDSKAKEARRIAERLIKYSISGTLADKRRIIFYLKNRDVAHELIRMGQDNFASRPRGGYTAIYRLGSRKGDGARMVLLKLIVETAAKKEVKRKRKPTEAKIIEAVEAPIPATEKTPQKKAEKTTEEIEAGEIETEAISEEEELGESKDELKTEPEAESDLDESAVAKSIEADKKSEKEKA